MPMSEHISCAQFNESKAFPTAKIGFVILTWNSEKCIGECLKSIRSMDFAFLSGKVIVVDNGSSDKTLEIVRSFTGSSNFTVEVLSLDKNYGTTSSRNKGITRLLNDPDIEYICILDSDTVVNANAVLNLMKVLENDKGCAVVGPRMKDKNGVFQNSGRNIPTLIEKLFKVLPFGTLREKGLEMETSVQVDGSGISEVGYLMSACWMIRKEIFKTVGLLDEKIFYAPEDAEFCIRCHKAGYTVKYCRDAEIVHEWQRLSRKKLFSKHNFEHIKGLAYMFLKHKYLFSTEKIEKIYEKNRESVKI